MWTLPPKHGHSKHNTQLHSLGANHWLQTQEKGWRWMLGTRWSKAASASLHLTREPRGPGMSNSANFSSPTRQFQSSFHSKVKGLLVCIANCKSAQRNFLKVLLSMQTLKRTRKIGLISDTAQNWGGNGGGGRTTPGFLEKKPNLNLELLY